MYKKRLFLLILSCISGLCFLCAEDVYSFLSGKDALVVGEYLSILDQEINTLSEARFAAVEAEAVHAYEAGRISANLDAYASDPAWIEAYALAAQKKMIPELTLKDHLFEEQQLRFEHATQLTQDTYTVDSGENALAQDERIRDIGNAFSLFLKDRIEDASRTDLYALEERLAGIVSRHPDTPLYTLCSLHEGARELDDPQYKQWLLSLAAASPNSIAELLMESENIQDPVFTALYTRFSKEYASRKLLRDIYQAAAALYWSVDSYAAYTMIQTQRMDAVNRFMRNLGAVDGDHLNLYLSEDPVFRRAFVEALSILWIVNLYERERYIQDYKLDPDLLDQTLRTLASVRMYDTVCDPAEALEMNAPIDNPAQDTAREEDAETEQRKTELEALRYLETLSLLLENEADPQELLSVFADAVSNPYFFDFLGQGTRYAEVHAYLKELFDGTLLKLYAEDSDLHVVTVSDFPDAPLVFSACRPAADGSLSIPLSPEAAYKALGLPDLMAETGYVMAVLPSLQKAQPMELPEIELDTPVMYGNETPGWTEKQLKLLCTRNGIPASLVMPSEAPYGLREYHYRLLSRGAIRLAMYARQR